MKKTLLFLLLLAGALGSAVAAIAALDGKWSGTLKGPDGNDYNLSYTFKTEGDKLTGTAETPFGSTPIQNGKISGNDFSFDTNLGGTDVPHKGKIYTDSLGVDLTYNSMPLHVTLKKAAQ